METKFYTKNSQCPNIAFRTFEGVGAYGPAPRTTVTVSTRGWRRSAASPPIQNYPASFLIFSFRTNPLSNEAKLQPIPSRDSDLGLEGHNSIRVELRKI
jgi:hypothetical protein